MTRVIGVHTVILACTTCPRQCTPRAVLYICPIGLQKIDLSRENSNLHVYHYDCSAKFAKIIFSIGCLQSILDVKQHECVALTNPLLFIASWGLDCKNFAAGALEVGRILPVKPLTTGL